MRTIIIIALMGWASVAHADLCQFRPSAMAGKAGSVAKSTASTVASAAKDGAQAVGRFTLENPATGISMLSSGVGSVSAAGGGIASGAGGALSAAGAVVTAPVTLTVAGASAVALGGFEGLCYFRADRITDDAEILSIVQNMAANSDPTMFALIPSGASYTTLDGEPATAEKNKVRIASAGVGPYIFDVENLYIAKGVLKHRDALRDTVIGNVALDVVEVDAQ